MSIQKREFLVKIKKREDCNQRNTLEYFEDFNLKRDIEIDWPKGPFMDGHYLKMRHQISVYSLMIVYFLESIGHLVGGSGKLLDVDRHTI